MVRTTLSPSVKVWFKSSKECIGNKNHHLWNYQALPSQRVLVWVRYLVVLLVVKVEVWLTNIIANNAVVLNNCNKSKWFETLHGNGCQLQQILLSALANKFRPLLKTLYWFSVKQKVRSCCGVSEGFQAFLFTSQTLCCPISNSPPKCLLGSAKIFKQKENDNGKN